MSQVFDPEKSENLIAEERKEWLPPQKILNACGLEKGDLFFDVGCGNGFFTLPAAGIVDDGGEVHGFDISTELLEELSQRRNEMDLTNVYLHQVDQKGLAPDKMPGFTERADILFFANILHEVDDPGEFMQSYLRLVNPESGRVVIIDWRKQEQEAGPDRDERLAAGEIQSLLQKYDLEIIFSRVLNERYYMFVALR